MKMQLKMFTAQKSSSKEIPAQEISEGKQKQKQPFCQQGQIPS